MVVSNCKVTDAVFDVVVSLSRRTTTIIDGDPLASSSWAQIEYHGLSHANNRVSHIHIFRSYTKFESCIAVLE